MPALENGGLMAREPLAFPGATVVTSVPQPLTTAKPEPVLAALRTLHSDASSFSSYASEYNAGHGNNAYLGSILEANSALLHEFTDASSTAKTEGPLTSPGASTVFSAFHAVITGSAGIRSLLDVLVSGVEYYSSDGIEGQVSQALVTQSEAAGSFAAVLVASAPKTDKATATALSISIESLFHSAIAKF